MSVSYKKLRGKTAGAYYLNCSDTASEKRGTEKNVVLKECAKFGNQLHAHRVVFELPEAAKEEKRVQL